MQDEKVHSGIYINGLIAAYYAEGYNSEDIACLLVSRHDIFEEIAESECGLDSGTISECRNTTYPRQSLFDSGNIR